MQQPQLHWHWLLVLSQMNEAMKDKTALWHASSHDSVEYSSCPSNATFVSAQWNEVSKEMNLCQQ
jgi:hypothetical protein